MKRLTLTLMLLWAVAATAFSQTPATIILTGKITNAKWGALPFVTIVANKSISVQSDFDGIYRLIIPVKDTSGTLIVSRMDMIPKKVSIKAFVISETTDKIYLKDIVLEEHTKVLDSVMTACKVSSAKLDAPRSEAILADEEKRLLSSPSVPASMSMPKGKPVTPSVKREMAVMKAPSVSYTVESMDRLAIKSTASVVFYEDVSIKNNADDKTVSTGFSTRAMDVDKTTEKRDILKAATFAEDLIAIPEVHNFLKDVEKANKMDKSKDKIALFNEDDDIEPEPSAGQLTAGEWSDLKNWEFWKKSLDDTFKSYVNAWKMNLTQRYSLILRGSNEQPISDAVVQLIGTDGLTIWTARTDNTGRAELFADGLGATKPAKMSVQYAGKSYSLDKIRKVETGANELKIPVACGFSPTVDIAFVVDATGSMGDEIAYLKAELADVIRQVKRDNQQLSVRLGSVFYRDFGDAYLTRTFPFDKSLKKNIEFIKNQVADGGGDIPEAVPEGLEAAIDSMAWSENAVTRLLFLVLDAPPHLNAENVAKVQRLTAKAAEKGIRIIPIAASGVDQNTEYLMKAFAVATGGTYTFLTDDSGIGGTHIKATTEKHEVELLNALLVRLIKQYTTYEACNDLTTEATTGGDSKFGLNFRAYPNPVRDVLNLELKTAVTDVFITNAQGQTVRKLGVFTEGVQTIDVSELLSGVYFVHFKKEGVVCTKKISVVK